MAKSPQSRGKASYLEDLCVGQRFVSGAQLVDESQIRALVRKVDRTFAKIVVRRVRTVATQRPWGDGGSFADVRHETEDSIHERTYPCQ